MSSLNAKLLLNIVLISSIVTIALSAVQGHFRYQNLKQDSLIHMKHISEINSDNLGLNLWELNQKQIDNNLLSYLKNDDIVGVELVYDSLEGQQTKLIGKVPKDFYKQTFDIVYEKETLAVIHLYGDQDAILKKLISELYINFIIDFIKFFIVSMFIFISVRYLILRHIIHITDFIKSANIKKEQVLELDRKNHNVKQDEFSFLVASINADRKIILENEKELENKIALRTKELKKSNQAKSLFLASMSHEIRTPLMAISSCLELVKDEKLSSETEKLVNIAISGSDTLVKIVNDILEFSKLETNSVVFERMNYKTVEFFEQTILLYRADALKKGIELKLELAENLPNEIFTDALRVRQVVGNLISNAIKFTENGEVKLKAKISEGLLEIYVHDTGIGIDQDKIDQIFEYFQQEDISTTRKFGGTGLGLAISKSIVSILEGEILVESQKNKGSTFIVKLPLVEAPNEAISHKEAAESNIDIDFSKVHLLLAEDNLVNQKIIEKLLIKIGVHYQIASNGEEAYQMIKQSPKKFNFIIMDYHMPVMDGLDSSRKIIEFLKGETPPIIALTASVLDEDRENCLAAGMKDFLSKPIKLDELKRAIAKNFKD